LEALAVRILIKQKTSFLQILVKVKVAGLNPVDYKIPEFPVMGWLCNVRHFYHFPTNAMSLTLPYDRLTLKTFCRAKLLAWISGAQNHLPQITSTYKQLVWNEMHSQTHTCTAPLPQGCMHAANFDRCGSSKCKPSLLLNTNFTNI
jgi:hypothetical protein